MDVNFNSVTGLPYGSSDFLNNIGTNPMVLLILVAIIIIYYFIFASLGNNADMSSAGRGGVIFLEVLLWGVFIVLILLNGMSYFFNINVVASIQDLFSDIPKIQISSLSSLDDGDGTGSGSGSGSGSDFGLNQFGLGTSAVPEMKLTKEVFNVPGNYYNYDDAKAICTAYGGRLAKYEEVESAYKKGAGWCNYGWSDNQLALFPTQKSRYDQLQKIEGHENDCGRPGINGGYIANPNVQFGANCYGYKPKITPAEQLLLDQTPLYPQTTKELAFEQKVSNMKTNLKNILVSPFNNKQWSVL